MTNIEAIILGVVALAFVFLIIFLVLLIVQAIKTLKKVNSILDSLGNEPIEIVQNFHNKIKSLDPIFESIANIGEGLEYKTYSFKERAHWKCYKDKINEADEYNGNDKISKIMDYVLLSINLWKNLKKK